MSNTLVSHLPEWSFAVALFLTIFAYYVARIVYLMCKRDLFYAGYDEGSYSTVAKHARMRYHPQDKVVTVIVSQEELDRDFADGYQRFTQKG